jgi:tryptophan synthase alpha chain
VRADVAAPIVVFTYANPVFRCGVDRFAKRAADAGVDGVLILDLPIEEAAEVRDAVSAAGLDMIFLLSPTTTDARIEEASRAGSGFLYAVSRLGVTGARDTLADGAEPLVRRIRAHSSLPVALGFGISRPEHVRQVGR